MPDQSMSQTCETCDICQQEILPGDRFNDDGSEIAHTSCIRGWFRGNFGREGLS